ncbi:MAG: glycine cleavage T C-terminal barrel domain-containing protein, partial [Burkholderiales bacterium]
DGRLFDDGVVFRLGFDHFWVTTTTGNTDAAFAWLEHCRQNLFRSRAFIVPVQSQWANAVICGPRSRDLLASIGTDIDLDRDAFPFMAMRAGHVGGLAARVFRVSFTGELSYEINVAASHGAALWAQLMEAGNIFDITPLGSEANHVLRIEKGYISIGHEGDGTATPFDLTLDRFVAMEKADFIGKRALEDDLFDRPRPRRELVGLLPTDPKVVLPEGAQVLAASTDSEAIGFVTASVMSPTLRRSIALALVDDGRDRQETSVHVTLGAGRKNDRRHQRAEALVTPALFFDPTGARLRG